MENGEKKPPIPWWQPSVMMFARLSGWIGGPIIIAVVVGKWLDNKYHTDPWLFLLSVGIAFVISFYGLIRDAMREMKRIDREAREKKLKQDDK